MKHILLIIIALLPYSKIVLADESSDPNKCITIEDIQFKEIAGPLPKLKSISWKAVVGNKCSVQVSAELSTRAFDKDDYLVVSDITRSIFKPLDKTTIYGKTRDTVPVALKVTRVDILVAPNRFDELRKSLEQHKRR